VHAQPGRVAVIGSLNIDLVTRVERLPRPGETVPGSELARLPGGKGANQALAAAGAGATTALVGRVGADQLGRAYRAELARRGVDTGAVLVTPGVATGQALITVAADGENSIVVMPGANAHLTAADVDSWVDRARPGPGTVVLLQLEVALPVVAHAARRAAKRGARVILNPSPVRELPPSLLRLANPLVVNRHEAALLAGLAGGDPAHLAAALLARGVPAVVITLGPGGARLSTPDGSAEVAAPAVTAVDTTGAGDVFAGTLAAGLAAGTPLPESVPPAVAAASQATTYPGAQGWAFDIAPQR
jgi:ribokinase